MNIHVAQATPQDAQTLINLLNQLGGETDNYTFGKDGFREQDPNKVAEFLARQEELGGFTLLAWNDRSRKKGGPELLGTLSIDVCERPRMQHRAVLSLGVLRQFWGQGVGTRLMEQGIGMVTNTQAIEVLACDVRADNERAIRLYERFGLERTGVLRGLIKVDGELHDAITMSRVFHRGQAKPEGVLFYLDDIVDAIDSANDNMEWYACLDTGEVEMCLNDNWGWGNEDEDVFDPETAEGRWEPLPDRYAIDDWGCMRDFAALQDENCRQRLLGIIHRRGAYRKFKDECARRGLLQDYYAFQSSWHRNVAIRWLEEHNCVWTEGRRSRA